MTLKLLGQQIRIVADAAIAADVGHVGQWRYRACEIAIDPGQCAGQQGDTLIHEMLEAINSMIELRLEHRTITSLGAVLHQVLRDNPKLMRAVIEGRPILAGRKTRQNRPGQNRDRHAGKRNTFDSGPILRRSGAL